MATNNPRVAAYLLPKNFERLKAFSKGRGLSLSQAIDTILSEYFGGSPPSNTPQIEARLAALEASLGKVDSLNFEVVVTNEAIAAIQADLARLNSVLFSSTSTAPDPQTNSRVSEPLSSTNSDEVAFKPLTTLIVSEPLSSTSIAPDPQTNSRASEPLSSTDKTQPNPSSGEAGELLSSQLGSTSDFPSPEPLLEKDALNVLASVEPHPSGELKAEVLLNDTLSDSPQLGLDEAESTEARSSAVTSEPQSSLLKSEDENGQLYQQAIKRAKELKKKRLTQTQIADTLNAEGFTTITGKKWTRAAISRLFG